MGVQPTKNSVEYDKYVSNEVNKIIRDIQDNDAYRNIPSKEISIEHFLLTALNDADCMLYKCLNAICSTYAMEQISDSINNIIAEKSGGFIEPHATPEVSNALKQVFSLANKERLMPPIHQMITSDHVLLAIMSHGEDYSKIVELFTKRGVSYANLRESSVSLHNVIDNINKISAQAQTQPQTIFWQPPIAQAQTLLQTIMGATPKFNTAESKYCSNLNVLAEEGKLSKVIERDNIISSIISTLSRMENKNIVLVGENGVGKSAIIEGFTKMIVDGLVPEPLQNITIYKLNMTDVIAGTEMRGSLENKIVEITEFLKNKKNSILYIDALKISSGSNDRGDSDIMSSISEAVSNNKFNAIISTTQKGYKRLESTAPNLLDKFKRIDVDELSIDSTVKVLQLTKTKFEEYHGVKYSDASLEKCAKLAKRYISDKKLPSSAIDILDECGAFTKISNEMNDEVIGLKEALINLKEEKDLFIRKDEIDKAEELNKDINKAKLDIRITSRKHKKRGEINEDDICNTISRHTGIPVKSLNSNESSEMANIDEKILKKVVGQDEAVNLVCNAIKRNKVGLSKKNKPIASFMFLGKTGVGKTLMAKAIAKEIFGDEKYLNRFDMSEYSDKTSVNKLIGSSAGYVGYENGGLLTESVKNNKYCVLLFDEIEKATVEVYNTLLQVLDEGFLTDNMGTKVDFRNTIVIMTSNVGATESLNGRTIGFSGEDNGKELSEKALKKKFPPEFINRVDEIVYFNNLTDENLRDIINLELNKVSERLKENDIIVTFDESINNLIFDKLSEEREYGARPVIRYIQRLVENRLADYILENNISKGKLRMSECRIETEN